MGLKPLFKHANAAYYKLRENNVATVMPGK